MRTVTFGGACSLDHLIARPDGAADWILWSDDLTPIMTAYWANVDAVVMGRKTYEVSAKMGGGGTADVKAYLCSRTLAEPPAGCELVRDAVGCVRRLKGEPGKGICVMGGGELARDLFEADLIDEIGLNVHPVLLGSGVPLFHRMSRQIDLELVECRPLKLGCVLVRYLVKHRTA